MKHIDRHGNINAQEGVDRCQCGCKYWENDKCIDCGTLIEIVKIRRLADVSRFGNEIKLNVIVTTMVHYNYGWTDFACTMDVVDIHAKYRRMGVIQ